MRKRKKKQMSKCDMLMASFMGVANTKKKKKYIYDLIECNN